MGIIQELLGPIGTLFHFVFYEPVFNVLMLVYMLVHNFALAIIVLTILIRVALIPLTRAQLKSQQEMQRLAPELKRIQQQYRNDLVRLREEQQALYREHGVSPAKGCLPLLIQMPFLYALYYAFFTVLRGNAAERLHAINTDLYPFIPHFTLSALPNTHFLWTDLAVADPLHILPILAGVLTFIQLRMAMPVKKPAERGAAPDATSQATSTMQYIMPFITVFIGWGFPSGLALYWCFSTLFSAVQQYFINGNFGSLFVGVPGMEHLVPPPKDLTTTTTTPALSAGGRGGTRGASAIVPSKPEPSGGGWRGLVNQLRAIKEGGAGPTVASEPPIETRGERIPGARAKPTGGPNGTGGAAGYPRERERRSRATREGAKLVRPTPPGGTGPELLPEDEIARQGTSARNGKPVLPEEAIAREATTREGDNPNGTNGKTTRPGGPGNMPRSNSANNANYRKGSPRRPGGGRPKGGR